MTPSAMASLSPRRRINLLLRLLPPLLTLALYWRTLAFPFFWDDAANFDLATTRTFLQVWTDVSGFPYYRPILFTFWKAALALLPPAPTLFFHAINLAAHAANGLLIGQVTRHLVAQWFPAAPASDAATPETADLAGLAAAILFVVYPAAVLPVSLVASLFHLAVTLATLGATLAALEYARERKWRWLSLALLLTVLAPYVHEYGVVAGAVVALALVAANPQRAWRDKWLVAAFPLLSTLFLPVWLAVPKSRESYTWVGWSSIGQSLSFFIQGPSFPLQFLARPLMQALGWNDLVTIWIVALAAMAAALTPLLRLRRWQPIVLVSGWFALASSPSILVLSFGYILTSPRLLYYVAPGAALLWAVAVVTFAARLPRPHVQHIVALALPVLAAVPATLFVQREIALHTLALEPVWQIAAIARQYPQERHLVINALNWVTYRNARYGLGHEGVVVMPAYVTLEQLGRLNSGVSAHFTAQTFPIVKSEPEFHFYSTFNEHLPWDWATFAAQALAYDRVWLTTYSDRQIRIGEAGAIRNGEAARPAEYLANFEHQVFLTAAEYSVEKGEAVVTLAWKYLGPDPNATVFRHLFDCQGNVLALGDGHALERMVPFTYLSPGAEVRDIRHMPLDAISSDGCYSLEVGLFHPDGSRLQAFAPDGSEFENAVVPIRPSGPIR